MSAPARRLLAAACALSLGLSACQPKVATMTADEQRRMAPILAKLTPRCVGRYVIDIPQDFVLNPVSKALIEGVTIEVQPMSRLVFEQRFSAISQRLSSLRQPGSDRNLPHLRAMIPLPGKQLGAVFDRAASDATPDRSRRILELHSWQSEFFIQMTIEAFDGTFPEDAGDKYFVDRGSDVPQKLAHLLGVFERTRGRADDEVPSEPGVCFANGFVRGPATSKEDLVISYDMGGLPKGQEDGGFTIHSISDMGPQKTTLLQRGPEIEANLVRVGGATLRSGKRNGLGLDFEEWLLRRPNERKVMMYDFTLELNSKEGNAEAPLFILDFGSGMGIARPPETLDEAASRKPLDKAIFNEAESIAIWDAVVPTLRKRPGGF